MLSRVLKSLNAMLFGQLTARLGSLLLVPLFLSYWSPTLYGEWLTMFALVGYLATLDIGVQTAAVNRMTRSFARGELGDYRQCQHSALGLCVITAGGGSVLLLLAAGVLPLSRWIGLRNTDPAAGKLVLVLLGMSVLWSLPARVVFSTYQTIGNLAKSQWLSNIQQVLGVVLVAAILLLHGGMIPIALTQVLLLALLVAYTLLDLKLHLPQLFPGLGLARWPVMRELFKPSILFALLTVSNLLVFQGSILLVSTALGGLTVALFSITRTLSTLLRQVIDIVGISLWPDLAGMEGRGEFGRLRRVHWILVVVSGVIATTLGAALWYEGVSVITVWTRGRVQPDVVLLRLFVLYAVLQAPWIASAAFQVATNQHRHLAVSYVVSATSGLGLAAVSIGRIGAWAVPISLTIGEALACYHFVVKRSCTLLGENYGAFALRLWAGLTAVAAVAMATGAGAHYALSGPALVRWIIVGCGTFASSTLMAWTVWMRAEDRAALRPKFRLVWRFLHISAPSASATCLPRESAGSGEQA